jgi:hypothetical protein
MSIEKKRLLDGSGNPTKSQLDEFLRANKFITSDDTQTYFQNNDNFGRIWKYLFYKWQKEYNNFTPSLIDEFLSVYPVISNVYFEVRLAPYEIEVYPDPIINLETGESLDLDGNTLPNCPLCWNILNINILEISEEFKIKKLPCGGLFHDKCINTFFRENHTRLCPICGQ